MDEARALQDVLKVHCFGCGALNERGLQIKSHLRGDEVVCEWQPPPHHVGHPGVVYGGTIASIVDCHSIWTAASTFCREAGIDLQEGPPFVTGRLTINYLKPADVARSLQLRARVTRRSERRFDVACSVRQGEVEVATGEVVAVCLRKE